MSRNFPDGSQEEFFFDEAGQLTRARNAAADIRYTHDLLGRVTEHRYANYNKAFLHSYDASGNRLSLTYPDGQTITYGYNAAHEQVSAFDSQAGTFALEYDETGMRRALTYPCGDHEFISGLRAPQAASPRVVVISPNLSSV